MSLVRLLVVYRLVSLEHRMYGAWVRFRLRTLDKMVLLRRIRLLRWDIVLLRGLTWTLVIRRKSLDLMARGRTFFSNVIGAFWLVVVRAY